MRGWLCLAPPSFSALQRAEIAEMPTAHTPSASIARFSALQRAEIAEMIVVAEHRYGDWSVSVLFNEPKLLKCRRYGSGAGELYRFQCSSTSRNC